MNIDDHIVGLLGTSPDRKYSARQIGQRLSREWSGVDPEWFAPCLELLVMQRRVRYNRGQFWFSSGTVAMDG